MTRTRILVADGMTIFRNSVRDLLARESDLEVVEAADLVDLRRATLETTIDIALVDLELPPVGGVSAVAWLRGRTRARTIVWSFEPTRQSVVSAVRAGASGALHKNISAQGLVRTLRGVMHGEAALSREVASFLIDAIHEQEDRERALARLAVLSTRERQILDCVAQGARNREIAMQLTISEFTVKRHMQNILGKLEVESRREAADFYHQAQAQFASVGSAA